MHRLKRLFLSRKTVLILILLILFSVLLAYIIPQRFYSIPENIEKWQQSNPSLAPFVIRFGLDHVYTTPWFAALLFIFLITLSISAFQQIKVSFKKTFSGVMPSGGNEFKKVDEVKVSTAIKEEGYLRMAGGPDWQKFVKYPWGYWGNVFLHLGIIITIASSLLIVLTEKRGLIYIYEREVHMPADKWTAKENGMLSENFVLPYAVRLEIVKTEFWDTDELKQLTSVLSFISEQGRSEQRTVAINQVMNYRGLNIYQQNRFGSAFFVEIADDKGFVNNSILQIESPQQRDKAGYGNFMIEGVPNLLKAKYFADAEKRSIDSNNPLLTLRLADKEKIIGEVSLKKGESGKLGPYTVRLADVLKWSGIIFADTTGMPGIFIGFFIIIIGSSIIYFMPPREIYLRRSDGGLFLLFRAGRFEDLHKEEFERISKGSEGRRSE